MKIIYEVVLNPTLNKPTGNTTHYIVSGPITNISKLQITECDGETGSIFYLLYLDENDHELTDTFHESLESAFEQAEFEFQIQRKSWLQI